MEERLYWCDICGQEAAHLEGLIKSQGKLVGAFDLCQEHWMYGLYFKVIPLSIFFKALRENQCDVSVLSLEQSFEQKTTKVSFHVSGAGLLNVEKIFDELAQKNANFNNCHLKPQKDGIYELYREFKDQTDPTGKTDN